MEDLHYKTIYQLAFNVNDEYEDLFFENEKDAKDQICALSQEPDYHNFRIVPRTMMCASALNSAIEC